MRNFFFILYFSALHLVSFSQTDSTIIEIIKSDYPKPELIKKCNHIILNRIRFRDYEGAKRITDFLIDEVKESEFISFDEDSYPLVLYWIRDYTGLLKYFTVFDSLIAANNGKIKPSVLDLEFELAWSIPEEGERIIDSIRNSDFKKSQKEVLKLGLYRQMIDTDYKMSNRQLNFRTNTFLVTHPFSMYNDYLKKEVKHSIVPLVGIGFEFSLNYGIFTNELNNYFRNNLGLITTMDLYYNRTSLSFQMNWGQSKTKQDIPYSLGYWPEGSKADLYLYQVLLGHTIKNRYSNILDFKPFAGIGATQIIPCNKDLEKYPDLKSAGLDFALTYSVGLNIDLNLDYFLFMGDHKKSDFLIRFGYYYNHMNFDKTYEGLKGGMHTISLGIGAYTKKYLKISRD